MNNPGSRRSGAQVGLQPLQTKQQSLQDLAYSAIRTAIITKALPPGTKVSEAGLAASLNVSKTPVREALLRLTSIGLLESDGRSGVRVTEPSLDGLRAAFDVREGLEVQSARLAAGRVGEAIEGLTAARDAANRCLAAAHEGDQEAFGQYDRIFHQELAEMTQNSYLIKAIAETSDVALALRVRDAPAEVLSVQCAQEHVAVIDAVAVGDVVSAGERMREHISKARASLTAVFETVNSDS